MNIRYRVFSTECATDSPSNMLLIVHTRYWYVYMYIWSARQLSNRKRKKYFTTGPTIKNQTYGKRYGLLAVNRDGTPSIFRGSLLFEWENSVVRNQGSFFSRREQWVRNSTRRKTALRVGCHTENPHEKPGRVSPRLNSKGGIRPLVMCPCRTTPRLQPL